jgi:hypothetical protein
MLQLLAALRRGSAPFLGGDDRALDQEDASAWYFRPELRGEISKVGVTMATSYGGLEVNRSDPRSRFLLVADGGDTYLDLALSESERIEGGFFTGRGAATLALALGAGFDAAVVASARHAPQDNLRLRLEGGGGIEWLLWPMLEEDGLNAGARYQLMAVLEIGGHASLLVQLGAGVEIGLVGQLSYRRGSIQQPADPGALDPVATLLGGSELGSISYQASLTLAVTLGNGLLRARDQR